MIVEALAVAVEVAEHLLRTEVDEGWLHFLVGSPFFYLNLGLDYTLVVDLKTAGLHLFKLIRILRLLKINCFLGCFLRDNDFTSIRPDETYHMFELLFFSLLRQELLETFEIDPYLLVLSLSRKDV